MMLLPLGPTSTYSLEFYYESGGGAHPLDIDGRVAGTLAWLQGTQVPTGPGTPNAISLHAWTLRRATNCAPLSVVDPTPSLFTLPQGCSFAGVPSSGADQTVWKVDCGAVANRDARGTLGAALDRQGWKACGIGLGSGTWALSRFILVVAESSGSPGDYPTLFQRLNFTDSCR